MTHLQALLTLAITWAVSVVWDIIGRTIQGSVNAKRAVGVLVRIVLPILAILLVAGQIDAQTGTLTFTWTAPGDLKPNGSWSRCVSYQVRIDTLPIDTTNCTTARLWPTPPLPKAPGAAETLIFTGLMSERWYYCNIRAADSAGNWATCSNTASKATADVRPPQSILNLQAR